MSSESELATARSECDISSSKDVETAKEITDSIRAGLQGSSENVKTAGSPGEKSSSKDVIRTARKLTEKSVHLRHIDDASVIEDEVKTAQVTSSTSGCYDTPTKDVQTAIEPFASFSNTATAHSECDTSSKDVKTAKEIGDEDEEDEDPYFELPVSVLPIDDQRSLTEVRGSEQYILAYTPQNFDARAALSARNLGDAPNISHLVSVDEVKTAQENSSETDLFIYHYYDTPTKDVQTAIQPSESLSNIAATHSECDTSSNDVETAKEISDKITSGLSDEYYEDVEKTFKDQFKLSQNKLYLIPKKMFDEKICKQIASSFSKSIKELKFLGCGSFGTVSLCEVDGIPGYYCAVKTLKIYDEIDDVKSEIEVLELASQCKYLPKMLYAGFRLGGYYIIVLECISGGTLNHHFANLKLDAMKVIFYQIAEALDFLHRHHRTHGDLKPDNIGLTAKGNVKLFDFGKSRNISTPCILPRGTRAYTAPEIFRKIDADGSIDWWSYGILVTTILQKQLPFYDSDKGVLKLRILHEKPDIIIDDPDAKDFVTKLLQKNPANRLVKSPWKHKFFNNVNKNIPLFIPGDAVLKIDVENQKDERFLVNPIAEIMLLDAGLMRYPTKECLEFMKRK